MNDGGDPLPLQLRREEPPASNVWNIFRNILKGCGLFCYMACPPIPENITRKLAFHPPPRGKMYRLKLLDGSEKTSTKAIEVHGKQFKIEIMNQSETVEHLQDLLFQTTTFFTVKSTSKNVIVGMHSRPRKEQREQSHRQVILFAQPNSSDLGWWSQPLCVNVPHLAEMFNCDVFAFDYSGFGCSMGYPSESNINNDIAAVYDHILNTMPDAEIILMGYSIGTTCVIDLASTKPIGLTGVILIAPFTSGLRLFQAEQSVEAGHPPACCVRLDRFQNVDKVPLINVPTLICHGTRDDTVSVAHGKALYAKLSNPVPMLIVYGADHTTIFTGRYWETSARIMRFLRLETSTRAESRQAFLSELVKRVDGQKRTDENRITSSDGEGANEERTSTMEEIDLNSPIPIYEIEDVTVR